MTRRSTRPSRPSASYSAQVDAQVSGLEVKFRNQVADIWGITVHNVQGLRHDWVHRIINGHGQYGHRLSYMKRAPTSNGCKIGSIRSWRQRWGTSGTSVMNNIDQVQDDEVAGDIFNMKGYR